MPEYPHVAEDHHEHRSPDQHAGEEQRERQRRLAVPHAGEVLVVKYVPAPPNEVRHLEREAGDPDAGADGDVNTPAREVASVQLAVEEEDVAVDGDGGEREEGAEAGGEADRRREGAEARPRVEVGAPVRHT